MFHSSKVCQHLLVLSLVCRSLIDNECLTFEISSCAKRPSSACDDSNIERGLSIEPAPDPVELLVAILVDAVQVFGPVQSYEQNSRCWV